MQKALAVDKNSTDKLKTEFLKDKEEFAQKLKDFEDEKLSFEDMKTKLDADAKEAKDKSEKLKLAAASAALLATGQLEAKTKDVEADKDALKAEREAFKKEKDAFEEQMQRFKNEKQEADAKREKAQKLAKEKAQAIKLAEKELYDILALNSVKFKYNSDELTAESEELLDKVVQVIKKNENFNYTIGGHTDSKGDENYNLNLSSKRAEKVKSYLRERDIDSGILTAKGFGSAVPIADNETAEGRLKNRRVVIEVVK